MVLILFSGLSSSEGADGAGGQAGSLPVVLVAPFEGSKTEVPSWSPAIGQALSEMLSESLGNQDKKIRILEASEANGQQNDVQPDGSGSPSGGAKSEPHAAGGSGKAAPGSAANSSKPDAGGSAGSDFILYGYVAEFAAQTNSSKIGDFISSSPFANLGANVMSARVRIDWRLVDAETKRVVTRGSGAGSAHGSEFDMIALAAADEKTSNATIATNVTSAAAHAKTAKAPAVGNGGANDLASVNNLFNGLSKAMGGSAAGTAAKPPKTAPKAGGDVPADQSRTLGYDNSEFMRSALGKATAGAVTNILEQLAGISLPEPEHAVKLKAATEVLKHTPGKVLAVAGKDTIIVSLGSKGGFKEGDQMELYVSSDVKDDKGNVVFTDEKPVGEITLTAVQEDRSRGSYAGDAAVQQGWTVKAK